MHFFQPLSVINDRFLDNHTPFQGPSEISSIKASSLSVEGNFTTHKTYSEPPATKIQAYLSETSS